MSKQQNFEVGELLVLKKEFKDINAHRIYEVVGLDPFTTKVTAEQLIQKHAKSELGKTFEGSESCFKPYF